MEAVGAARLNVYLWVMVALSVLDLSPVTTATPPSAALRNSLDLARLIDRLGYTRLWLREAHKLSEQTSLRRPRHHDRAGSGDYEKHPRRLGRRNAAEPRAVDGDVALQGAPSTVPRPYRS